VFQVERSYKNILACCKNSCCCLFIHSPLLNARLSLGALLAVDFYFGLLKRFKTHRWLQFACSTRFYGPV